MLYVHTLGTTASIPTRRRGLPATLLNYKGSCFLFDCGEGTQRVLMANTLGLMKIDTIFLTHWHADHFAGLIGLIQTMGMENRKRPLYIYGPKQTENYIEQLLNIGHYKRKYPVKAQEINEGDEISGEVQNSTYRIQAYRTRHDCPSLGYVFVEDDTQKANREKMTQHGLSSSPLVGRLLQGETVTYQGTTIEPADVIDTVRGRKVVYTGDTEAIEKTARYAQNADLLIHDATYSEETKEDKSGHSSAQEAAYIAKQANVRQLLLTHIGRKYDKQPELLEEEAQRVFTNASVAEDMQTVALKPYRPE